MYERGVRGSLRGTIRNVGGDDTVREGKEEVRTYIFSSHVVHVLTCHSYRKFGGVVHSTAYVMFPDFESARKATDDCASKRFLMKKQIVQVEIAPYQRIAKPIDENIRGMGTIEEDPDYIEFLKNLEAQKNENLPSAEERLIQQESTKQDQSSQNASAQSNLVQYMLIRRKNEERKILQRKAKKKGKEGKKLLKLHW